jgi:DNA-binding transcriptional MerR regulator
VNQEATRVDEGNDFMALLQLQDSLDLVTKTELMDLARQNGTPVSDRQLTALASDGLIPKSARIGSRSGAYPRVVVEQLSFVKRWRGRGLSVTAVKELLPIWRYMQRARRDREVSLSEFEYIARASITLPEAWFAAPMVLQEALPCPNCDNPPLSEMKFLMKDGERKCVTDLETVSLGFVMFTEDEETRRVGKIVSMRLALPGLNEETNPSTVILGIPNGIDVPVDHPHHDETSVTTGLAEHGEVGNEEGAA